MTDDFVRSLGPAFLPHLLRRLSDQLVEGGTQWAEADGLIPPPRTHSTLFALERYGSLGVTELANLLRQSHPLAIQWIGKLEQLGLVTRQRDPGDARKSILVLTEAGHAVMPAVRRAQATNSRATATLMNDAGHDVWDILWKVEACLRDQSYRSRMSKAEGEDADDV